MVHVMKLFMVFLLEVMHRHSLICYRKKRSNGIVYKVNLTKLSGDVYSS